MGLNIATIFGSGLGQMIKDVVGTFKLSPEKQADLQQVIRTTPDYQSMFWMPEILQLWVAGSKIGLRREIFVESPGMDTALSNGTALIAS